MINLFEPASKDYSLQYLFQIFGNMHGVIPTYAGFTAGQTLGVMFQTFNSVVLAVGVLMVVYVTVMGVVMTAHEGTFMGKKWNNLWLPIRMVLGIATLIPTSSGYCGIQVVMMWVIVQGVGAADVLWDTLINKISVAGGSVFASVMVPSTGPQFNSSFLFSSVMCTRSAYTRLPNPAGESEYTGSYFCASNSGNSFCSKTDNASGIESANGIYPSLKSLETQSSFAMGPGGTCGTLSACDYQTACADKASLACTVCKAQHQVLVEIIKTFDVAAYTYIDIDHEYLKYYYAAKSYKPGPSAGRKPVAPDFVEQYCADKGIVGCDVDKLPNPVGNFMSAPGEVIQEIYWPEFKRRMKSLNKEDFVQIAYDTYAAIISGIANNYINSQGSEPDSASWMAAARSKGWIMAGSYYHLIADKNGYNQEVSVPRFEVSVNQQQPPEGDGPLLNTRSSYAASDNLMKIASGQNPTSSSSSDQMMGLITAGGGDMHTALMITVNGQSGANPLAQLAQTGRQFLMIGFVMFIVQLALAVVMAIIGISFHVLGTGVGGFGWIADALSKLLFPILFLVVGILLSVGALLGIYVPLIPYIVFTMVALGWLIATIEAMVAGPLVALGILSPSGQHELLGQAGPAIFLLFSIFLKPSLMIFGLITAMILSSVSVQMVNAGFSTINDSIRGGGGPLLTIFMTVGYVTLIIAVLNKTFSLIHLLPERTLRWIGGQGFGDESPQAALGEMKGAASAAGSQTGSAGREMGSAAQGSAMATLDDRGKDKEDAGIAEPGKGGEGPALPGQDGNHPKK